jgi:hypothetical protein
VAAAGERLGLGVRRQLIEPAGSAEQQPVARAEGHGDRGGDGRRGQVPAAGGARQGGLETGAAAQGLDRGAGVGGRQPHGPAVGLAEDQDPA